MLPVLQHPRCANCHGAIDVFAVNTTHAGGQIEAPTEDNPFGGDCQSCHTAPMPEGQRWRQPRPGDPARWGGLAPAQICRGLKASRMSGADLVDHVRADRLVALGFEGKRGQDLPAAPPPMTQDQFLALTQQWVTAIGSDAWSDPSAGCPAPLTGSWSSSYGQTVLTQTDTAVSGAISYTNGNTGQLSGTFDGHTLTYTWWNDADHGDGQLTLSASGCTLGGYFVQASDGARGAWTLTQC